MVISKFDPNDKNTRIVATKATLVALKTVEFWDSFKKTGPYEHSKQV